MSFLAKGLSINHTSEKQRSFFSLEPHSLAQEPTPSTAGFWRGKIFITITACWAPSGVKFDLSERKMEVDGEGWGGQSSPTRASKPVRNMGTYSVVYTGKWRREGRSGEDGGVSTSDVLIYMEEMSSITLKKVKRKELRCPSIFLQTTTEWLPPVTERLKSLPRSLEQPYPFSDIRKRPSSWSPHTTHPLIFLSFQLNFCWCGWG